MTIEATEHVIRCDAKVATESGRCGAYVVVSGPTPRRTAQADHGWRYGPNADAVEVDMPLRKFDWCPVHAGPDKDEF